MEVLAEVMDLLENTPKLGSGKRFASLEKKLAKKGNVSDPVAVAAAIGRKKWGAKRMSKMATAHR